MNRRLFIIIGIVVGVLLLLLVAAALLGGSGNKKKKTQISNEQITLHYWRIDDEKSTMDPIIQNYQKQKSNIKIEYKKLERDKYEQQLVEALAAGKGPDLFQVNNTWLPRYFDKIAPIPEDMYKKEDYEREFFKAVVSDTTVGNRIYAIPFYMDTIGLYYNNRLLGDAFLTDPPKTWEELVGKDGDSPLAKLNNRQGNKFNRSAIALGNNTVRQSYDVLALLMLQQRTEMVNPERDRALFNLPQKVEGKDEYFGRTAVDFYTSFARPNTRTYSWNDQQGDAVRAFTEGRVAMITGYPFMKQEIERRNPDLQFGVAGVPQIGGTDPVNYASYWPEVVSKTSQRQNEAWDFIRFVSDRTELSNYLEATKRVSPRRDVPGLGELEAFYKQNESAVTWYKGDTARANAIFVDLIRRVVGGEDIARAIDRAATEETAVLQDVKQRFGVPQ